MLQICVGAYDDVHTNSGTNAAPHILPVAVVVLVALMCSHLLTQALSPDIAEKRTPQKHNSDRAGIASSAADTSCSCVCWGGGTPLQTHTMQGRYYINQAAHCESSNAPCTMLQLSVVAAATCRTCDGCGKHTAVRAQRHATAALQTLSTQQPPAHTLHTKSPPPPLPDLRTSFLRLQAPNRLTRCSCWQLSAICISRPALGCRLTSLAPPSYPAADNVPAVCWSAVLLPPTPPAYSSRARSSCNRPEATQ